MARTADMDASSTSSGSQLSFASFLAAAQAATVTAADDASPTVSGMSDFIFRRIPPGSASFTCATAAMTN
jgi:hypothetical protein